MGQGQACDMPATREWVNYCKLPRDVWDMASTLRPSQRRELVAAYVEYFYTGVVPDVPRVIAPYFATVRRIADRITTGIASASRKKDGQGVSPADMELNPQGVHRGEPRTVHRGQVNTQTNTNFYSELGARAETPESRAALLLNTPIDELSAEELEQRNKIIERSWSNG